MSGALAADGRADSQVAGLAALNATLQTGFSNTIDTAIRATTPVAATDAQ